jgi:hypothetical protein
MKSLVVEVIVEVEEDLVSPSLGVALLDCQLHVSMSFPH